VDAFNGARSLDLFLQFSHRNMLNNRCRGPCLSASR
jgi:hypothetical protein